MNSTFIFKKIGLTFIFFIAIFNLKSQTIGDLEWVYRVGADKYDYATSMVRDASGNIFIAGYFEDTVDFDPGTGVYNLIAPGSNYNGYVLKLNASGNFIWAVNIGSTSMDYVKSITLDGAGNLYLVGYFAGTVDFDPSAATFNMTSVSSYSDIFILKLNYTGTFAWARSIGNLNTDVVSEIECFGNSGIIFTGGFQGTVDFDPGAGTYNMDAVGARAAYVCKFDTAGTFVWAKQMRGNSGNGCGYSFYLDAIGSIFMLGDFYGTLDFDPGAGTDSLTSGPYGNMFFAKLDPSGDYVWAKSFAGSSSYIYFNDIIQDDLGNNIITGSFTGTVDFDPGPGTANSIAKGVTQNAFFLKLDNSGNYIGVRSINGSSSIYPYSLAIDNSGFFYITGCFAGNADFDPGTVVRQFDTAGACDAFILKLDPGFNYNWVRVYGGADDDNCSKISIDTSGNIYAIGRFSKTVDFDFNSSVNNLISGGFWDFYILKLKPVPFTGINSKDKMLLSIYPNPTFNNLVIPVEFIGSTYEIMNCNGQKMLEGIIEKDKNSIEINFLASGIYVITINRGGIISNGRFVRN